MRGKPDAALASRIRELKDHCSLSYQQLADAIGVSNSTAHGYANGRIHIPADRLLSMTEAFGCAIRHLCMPPGSPLPQHAARERRTLVSPIGGAVAE